jgi:uncharacterized protein (TIGR00251 family)
VKGPSTQPWSTDPAGVRLLVRVSPKASREGIDGVMETAGGPAVTVRVRAVAEKGEANRAVEKVLADWLGVPKSSVAVAAGGKSRLKTILITGEPTRLKVLVAARIAKLR